MPAGGDIGKDGVETAHVASRASTACCPSDAKAETVDVAQVAADRIPSYPRDRAAWLGYFNPEIADQRQGLQLSSHFAMLVLGELLFLLLLVLVWKFAGRYWRISIILSMIIALVLSKGAGARTKFQQFPPMWLRSKTA